MTLVSSQGRKTATTTDEDGNYLFKNISPGTYHVLVTAPEGYGSPISLQRDVLVDGLVDPPPASFSLTQQDSVAMSYATEEPNESQSADPDPLADNPSEDPQSTATPTATVQVRVISDLPLRFARGRNLLEQLQARVLTDGSIWLGIPFRTQIDGGTFEYVNCGPASLSMVLSGFKLEVTPTQVRDYLNNLVDNYDEDLGTSLITLSQIAREAGLLPLDLYSVNGGFNQWTPDEIRAHVRQGHPVITLVKYRDLPGHSASISDFDHYIVITGLTPNGFIYNDAAFSSTLGYGLEISDEELQTAWDNSSIPHHAVALSLPGRSINLSLPAVLGTPTDTAEPAATTEDAMADENPGTDSTAPTPDADSLPTAYSQPAADSAPDGTSPLDQADTLEEIAPMGLLVDASTEREYQPANGPGRIVIEGLLVLLGCWTLGAIWGTSGKVVRGAPRLRFSPRAALLMLLTIIQGGGPI